MMTTSSFSTSPSAWGNMFERGSNSSRTTASATGWTSRGYLLGIFRGRMFARRTTRTTRAASSSQTSPYGTTSVGSRSGATRFMMSLMRTTCESLIHKLGYLKPRTTSDLLDVATNHASSEEAVGAVFNGGQDKGKAKRKDQDEGSSM